MKRVTFKILFFVKKTRVAKNGEVPIHLRITVNGERAEISVNLKAELDKWSDLAEKSLGKNIRDQEINHRLDTIRTRIMQIYREFEFDNVDITTRKIIENYLGNDKKAVIMLLEVFREHNEQCERLIGNGMASATVVRYRTSLKHTAEFIRHRYNRNDIPIEEVNHKFITDYEVYLKTICKCNSNTTAKFMQFFKRIVLIARNNGIIIGDPFANYKIRLQKVDRGYLTEDEIKKILELNLVSERLEHVRDLFIFSCFCGLAYIDVAGLRKEHIRKSFDGNLWIMTKRVKTGTDVNVPLLDFPKMILDKYKNKLSNGEILPIISNQKLNSYLKEIADLSGIRKNLTFHTARHRNYYYQLKTSGLEKYFS